MIAARALSRNSLPSSSISPIFGEKDWPYLIFLRDDAMAGPRAHVEQFKREIFAQCMAQFFWSVQGIDLFLFDVTNVQAPQLFAVDGGDGAVNMRVNNLVHDSRAVADRFEKR